MDKLLLKLFMRFNPLLTRAGVDVDQLFQIVNIKLVIDRRRPRTQFARKQSNTRVTNPWLADVALLLFGTFVSFLLFFNTQPIAGQAFYFTAFMFLLAFTLVSDFSTVLFDVRDQFILLPRPVNDRTLAVARIFHISIYILRMAFLQGLPAIILVGFAERSYIAPFVFVLQIIEATFLCILFVNIIYLLMMKAVSPQRFKDIITSFQIGFSILLFAIYYLLPRLIDMSVLEKVNLLDHKWTYLLPPVWISSVSEVIVHPGRMGLVVYVLAFIGLMLPVAGLWFVVKVLAPGFNKKLAVLATSDGKPQEKTATKIYKTDFRDKLANLLCNDPVENAGYRITWKMAARTREFKMRVFPSFAYVPFYFVFMMLQGKNQTLPQKLEHLQTGKGYVLLIYLCTIIIAQILANVTQTEKYKAAWVYYALPIGQPGKVLSGMYKAIISLYFFPYCFLLGLAAVCIWGPAIINDIILAFIICCIYGMLMALFMISGPPFSKPLVNAQAGGKILVSMLMLSLMAVAGMGHYWLTKFETAIWIAVVISGIIFWIMQHYYKKQSWASIEFSDVEPVKQPVKPKRSLFGKKAQ